MPREKRKKGVRPTESADTPRFTLQFFPFRFWLRKVLWREENKKGSDGGTTWGKLEII